MCIDLLFDYEWDCNIPVDSAGRWRNHWRGYLGGESVFFDFSVILGSEECVPRRGEGEAIFKKGEFTRCIVAAINGNTAESGKGKDCFQLCVVNNQLEITLSIYRYRDGFIQHGTFYLPSTVLPSLGLPEADLKAIDLREQCPFVGHVGCYICPE